MKIFSSEQIRKLDNSTLALQNISEEALMERAAKALAEALHLDFKDSSFAVFCGPGNNGGDGFALARMLQQSGHQVQVYYSGTGGSKARESNLQACRSLEIPLLDLQDFQADSTLSEHVILVDALFGSGLNRALEQDFASMVNQLNQLPNKVLSIDVPSGLFSNGKQRSPTDIKAFKTYTLDAPKLCFFHRLTAPYVGQYQVLDIGLSEQAKADLNSPYHYLEFKNIKACYTPRKKQSYKNTYGHALLMAGSRKSIGAALLAAKSCLKGGVGLLDVQLPKNCNTALNLMLPEAMLLEDAHDQYLSVLFNLEKYQAVCFGPGVGVEKETFALFQKLLGQIKVPLVIDADGLNLLAAHPECLDLLPKRTVLTPHIGELKRLLPNFDELDYLEQSRTFAKEHGIILIVKDSSTCICTDEGEAFFIDEGSVAAATAGSGDVLSGLLLAFLAQGKTELNAALLAVFMHARATRYSAEVNGIESSLASDFPNLFHRVFKDLQN